MSLSSRAHVSTDVCAPVAVAGVEQRKLLLRIFKQPHGFCSRTLQTVALLGAAGVAERSHAASKKQDSTAGQSI